MFSHNLFKKIARHHKKPSLQIDASKTCILTTVNKRKNKSQLVEILHAEQQVDLLQYWVGRLPIMHIPAKMLVMPGAHHYDSGYHPFVELIKSDSKEEFANFYKQFAPQTLAEMCGVKINPGELGYHLKPYDEPWFLRESKIPTGENGLSAEHGASFYGPVSEAKLSLEYQRVINTYNRIKKQGYLPHKFGHIDGFFLKRGNEYRFYVNGAKHRAAALTALGWSHIPVTFRDNMTRLVADTDVDCWPYVVAGKISRSLALSVFDAYFDATDPLTRC